MEPNNVAVVQTDESLLEEEHEAIVVGAIGTGAPWFLTGWVEGTEAEFMIDTVCQVTILATSIFEHMLLKTPCWVPPVTVWTMFGIGGFFSPDRSGRD